MKDKEKYSQENERKSYQKKREQEGQ
jgi:hypothetical protein